MLDDQWLNDTYAEQMNAFETAIKTFIKNAPQTCSLCNQMGVKKFTWHLNSYEDLKTELKLKSDVVEKLIRFYSDEPSDEDQLAHDEVIEVDQYLADDESIAEQEDTVSSENRSIKICETCATSIKDVKGGKDKDSESTRSRMPLFAEPNGFQYTYVPPEIDCLNFYERLLIQRARSFQTIVQLKPYTMTNRAGYFVKALKGLVVHLPLNTTATLNYTFKQLPNFEMLNILVYSLPTAKGVMWKNLVDLRKVKRALRYLKQFNKEYADIEIVEYLGGPSEPLVFVNEGDDTTTVPDESLSSDGGPQALEKESNLKHIVCSTEIDSQYTVMSVQTPTSDQTDSELFKQKRVEGAVVPISDKKVDLHSFPHLFPDGKNGLHQERERPISLPMFTKGILNHRERRFQRDFAYMFFLYHAAEQNALDRGVYACLHSRIGNVTVDQFRNMVSEEVNKQLEANLSMMFSKKRGSSDYWAQVNGDLRATDEEHGPATWFVTLSSAEYRWADLWEYLVSVNADLEGVDQMQQAKLCTEDPVSLARFFYHRFKTFLDKVILHPNGPLGHVNRHFWRLEYQARGAPHIHMKLWCKDAPVLGVNDAETIKAYLSDKVTCHIPAEKTSPELRDLVAKYQMHRCTGSCLRMKKCGKGKSICRCRYGFPRKETDTVELNTAADTVKSREISRNRLKRLYNLPRTHDERFVNDYNPLMLRLWKANIDVQYIGEESYILNRYVTSYVTKSETTVTREMWECLRKMSADKSHASRLKSLGLFKLKDREAGVYEVAHANLGLPFYHNTSHVRYVNVGFRKERKRKLKEKEEIFNLPATSRDLYCTNIVDDYYPARPDSLEDCSLHEIASSFDYLKKKKEGHKFRTEVFTLNSSLGFLRRRTQKQTIKIPKFNTKTSDGLERYFHGLLMLYKPWRNEESDLLGICNTYQKAFETAKVSLPDLTKYHASRKRLQDADDLIRRLKAEGAAEEAAANAAAADNVLSTEFAEFNSVATDNFPVIECSAEELQKNVDSLNEDQRKVFDEVVHHIDHQRRHCCVPVTSRQVRSDALLDECECGEPPDNLVALVSGVGGCGKSFLIDVLAQQLRFSYSVVGAAADGTPEKEDPVHITAPTGLAAFNVHGVTLHKKLKLPVQHGADQTFLQLCRDEEKLLLASMRNVHLMIVDEFSMVSNLTLLFVHQRLQQIFKSGAVFGGVNLILFGDLLQLRPVCGSFCFEKLTRQQLQKHFAGAVGVAPALLEDLRYFELLQNMRQKEDAAFAATLGRIRLGSPTAEDIGLLQTRVWKGISAEEVGTATQTTPALTGMAKAAELFASLLVKDPRAVCVMAKNEMVDSFNEAMIKQARIETVTISAVDYDTGRNLKVKKKPQSLKTKNPISTAKKLKSSDTAGLQEELVLGVGARVMLRRNISLEQGLVNGVIGYVTKIAEPVKTPPAVWVHFEGHAEASEITPVSADYEVSKGIIVTRRQFPLCLGYALTIHKSQGLTLRSILADLGSDVFEAGMAYVALSRVRSLDGVHLIQLDPAVLYCDDVGAKQYLQWRASAGIKGDIGPVNVRPSAYQQTPWQRRKTASKRTATKAFALTAAAVATTSASTAEKPTWTPLSNPPNPAKTWCYSNAVIQVLRCMPLVATRAMDWVQSAEPSLCLETTKEFLKLCPAPDSRVRSTSALRIALARSTGNEVYADFRQQEDAHNFFDALVNTLPAVPQLFTFQMERVFICQACPQPVPTASVVETATVLRFGCEQTQKFSALVDKHIEEASINIVKICDQCAKNTTHRQRVTYSCGPEQKYLIVLLDQFKQDEKERCSRYIQHRKITEFAANSVHLKLFRRNFRTLAAIVRIGVSTDEGHFYAWIRDGKTWIRKDDDKLDVFKNRFLNGLTNVYMLCFELI